MKKQIAAFLALLALATYASGQIWRQAVAMSASRGDAFHIVETLVFVALLVGCLYLLSRILGLLPLPGTVHRSQRNERK